MPSQNVNSTRALVMMAIALSLPGCARTTFTAPPDPVAPSAEEAVPEPPSRLSRPGSGQAAGTATPSPLDWIEVCSVLVRSEEETTVSASHYTLRFSKGSLAKDEMITIREYDKDVLDVQLGPHGTRFVTPVELAIDFAGTQADPSKYYEEAREPVLWYLNEEKKQWEEVPGTTDWKRLRHVVRLEHFSRYVLGGKAGWRNGPAKESD